MYAMTSLIHPLSFIISYLFPLRDFLYILQSEDYRTDRYIQWLPRFFFRRRIERRAHLAWTRRAQIVGLVTVALQLTLFMLVRVLVLTPDGNLLINAVVAFVVLTLTPLFVLWAHALTQPIFAYLHRNVWAQARESVAAMHDMQVVMIVGSYGKTKTRAYIEAMLRHSYVVATPPGNINTETGVAKWVAHSLQPNTQMLLLEADAYAEGDITRMCEIARPHIAVITALGDQHGERLGDTATMVRATQEAFTHAHEVATLVARTNVWDTLAAHGYTQGTYAGRTCLDASRIHADYAEAEEVLVNMNHTNRDAALRALAVASALHIPARFVLPALTEAPLPTRRQEIKTIHVTKKGGEVVTYEIMDDSYNISLETATSAITAAKKEADRLRKKLVVIVAGIPEAKDAAGDNTKLALYCLETAQHTVVIDSMFTPYFTGVFAREKEKYTVLPSVKNSVLNHLPTHFHPDEWFILLFNELGDLYH